MLNFEESRKHIFAKGRIVDGYFGKTRAVEFSFHAKSGQTVVTYEGGCYWSGLPSAVDTDEALWLLQHHPSSRATNVHRA